MTIDSFFFNTGRRSFCPGSVRDVFVAIDCFLTPRGLFDFFFRSFLYLCGAITVIPVDGVAVVLLFLPIVLLDTLLLLLPPTRYSTTTITGESDGHSKLFLWKIFLPTCQRNGRQIRYLLAT